MWTPTAPILRIYKFRNNKNFNTISEIFFLSHTEKISHNFFSLHVINDKAFPYPLTIDAMLLWNSTYFKLYNIQIQYLCIHCKPSYTLNLHFNTFMTVLKFLHCKRREFKVQKKKIHNSIKFSQADSGVRMWKLSDVSGTNSVPIFKVCW
jgi:hypothetical protein